MDVILKLGEHNFDFGESSIWIQFALTVLGAFLGFGTALFFYYKRLKREKKREKSNQLSKNKNRISYHTLLIENLVKNTEQQINLLEQFKLEQEKDMLEFIAPKQVATNDFQRLILINKDIFDSFNYFNNKENNWVEELKKLHTNIDFIEGTFKEINRITSNHLESCRSNATEIKQKIELIPDRLTSYAFYIQKELGEKRLQSDLYVFVNAQISKYGELVENKSTLDDFNNEYIEPMLNLIMQHYKEDPFLEEIIFLAKSARVKMNDIRTDVKSTIETFIEIHKKLESAVKKINEQNAKLIGYYNSCS
ncbi:MAG: hypothetical protein K9I74_08030 [Bacteroidales bacterium]|nr:hypothetical protein [Bacteroidales bacterium]